MKKNIFIACITLFSSLSLLAQKQPPKPPGKAERLKHVSEKIGKEITLSAVQKAKVEAAYKDFFDGMDKLRSKEGKQEMPPPPPPPPKDKAAVDQLSKLRDAKIKSALSAAQFKKYTEIEQSLRPQRPRERDDKQGPPPATKKQ